MRGLEELNKERFVLMKNYHLFNTIAFVLLVIGGLNWGLVGLFQWDLIASIFGEMSMISRTIYGLVGIAAVYRLVMWLQCKCKK